MAVSATALGDRHRVLTDEQCELLELLLPKSEGHVGRNFANNRLVVEGILYRLRTGTLSAPSGPISNRVAKPRLAPFRRWLQRSARFTESAAPQPATTVSVNSVRPAGRAQVPVSGTDAVSTGSGGAEDSAIPFRPEADLHIGRQQPPAAFLEGRCLRQEMVCSWNSR